MQRNIRRSPRSGDIAEIIRLGQVTINEGVQGGIRTDIRLEERRLTDGTIVLAEMEYTLFNTLTPRQPDIRELRVYTYEEYAKLIDMSGQVLDIMEAGDRRRLPVDMTKEGMQDGRRR